MREIKGTFTMHYKKNVLLLCGFFYTLMLVQAWNMATTEKEEIRNTVETTEEAHVIIEEKYEKPKIAITFDDGPHPVHTQKLLEGLKKRNVKASFFVIGNLAEANPKLIQQEKEDGHLIGNHTYHHVDIGKLADEKAVEEIQKTSEVIRKITGNEVDFVRPPFGVWQKKLEQEMSVIPVLWSVDPLDWTTENTDEIVNKVVTEVKENDIILLHDCYKSSVDAALRIIDILQKEGYEFVTVDEMILE